MSRQSYNKKKAKSKGKTGNINESKTNNNETNGNNTRSVPKNIFNKSLNNSRKKQVSLSGFSYLFCEILKYSSKNIRNVEELEDKLSSLGYMIGIKQLELMTFRYNTNKKFKDVIGLLEFIKNIVWKNLFGKIADGLEQSTKNKKEFFILESQPITNKYVSVPKDMGDFNPASFIAGIISGILNESGFHCNVIAHDTTSNDKNIKTKTVFIVKLK